MDSLCQSDLVDSLFKPNGSPKYIWFAKRRLYRPPCIVIDIKGKSGRLFQKRVPIAGKDVDEVWRQAYDLWLEGLEINKRGRIGKLLADKFASSLDAFLAAQEIDTAVRRVFLVS